MPHPQMYQMPWQPHATMEEWPSWEDEGEWDFPLHAIDGSEYPEGEESGEAYEDASPAVIDVDQQQEPLPEGGGVDLLEAHILKYRDEDGAPVNEQLTTLVKKYGMQLQTRQI